MDYSLLLGIHDCERAEREDRETMEEEQEGKGRLTSVLLRKLDWSVMLHGMLMV
jgi:hypothetical protein